MPLLSSFLAGPLATLNHAVLAMAATPGQIVGWQPFRTPMPIWNAWFWTLLPLAACIAVVYKTTKTPDRTRIARESIGLTLWIIGGLLAAAAVIAVVVRVA